MTSNESLWSNWTVVALLCHAPTGLVGQTGGNGVVGADIDFHGILLAPWFGNNNGGLQA